MQKKYKFTFIGILYVVNVTKRHRMAFFLSMKRYIYNRRNSIFFETILQHLTYSLSILDVYYFSPSIRDGRMKTSTYFQEGFN